jgi:glutamin-(asparagin-)ase
MSLPRIAVVATGGTIAGSAADATDATGYRAATTGIAELLTAIPALARVAEIRGEQFAQIDSSDMTDSLLIALARRVQDLADNEDVDGIVLTHGTDTLEETAYFLHLALATDKPVVLVGSMRPPTALSADGPRNMYAALVTAASPRLRGQGVLVVMNDEIHSARDVSKVSSQRLDAFASPYGPLGVVSDGTPQLYRSVARPHTTATEFAIPDSLPRAAVLFAHSGLDESHVAALGDYDVIVHAGFGNGTVSARLVDALEAARARGTLVVRASRTGSGTLTTIGASRDVVNGWVVVSDQNPQRARLLAALALTVTRDPVEIQRMFSTY